MKLNVTKDIGGMWGWEAVARNGRTLATSWELYTTPGHATRAAKTFIRTVVQANVKNRIVYEVEHD
jgi:uncharacterized protein YegP (UPF0339 family)